MLCGVDGPEDRKRTVESPVFPERREPMPSLDGGSTRSRRAKGSRGERRRTLAVPSGDDETSDPASASSRTERALDTITQRVGRPVTIVVIVLGIVAWCAFNASFVRAGWAFGPPPFLWLKRGCLLLTLAFLCLAHRTARQRRERAKRLLQSRLEYLEREALRDFLEGGHDVVVARARPNASHAPPSHGGLLH